ncbi:MAG TPA: alpha/beta hydrolase [Ilumatobacter sp.]|nr:alpha/beta hydrolase [Ilumatobacter sp.]
MSFVPICGGSPPAVDPLDEAGLRDAMRDRDRATVVAPGVTLGDVLELEERPPTPPGAVWLSHRTYATAGASEPSPGLHAYGRADARERRPGVLFLHGGGWAGGHTAKHVRNANRLAAQGLVTATATYRLSHQAPWPAALEDAKCAVRWMRASAPELGLDPDRLVVAGDSAGGHLAAMIALTPGRFEGSGGHPDHSSAVAGAFCWYPVTDLRLPGVADSPLVDLTVHFLGADPQQAVAEASPISWIHPGAPPIHSVVGDADRTTPRAMVADFHARLDAARVPNRLTVVAGADHAFDLLPEHHARCARLLDDLLVDVGVLALPRSEP